MGLMVVVGCGLVDFLAVVVVVIDFGCGCEFHEFGCGFGCD